MDNLFIIYYVIWLHTIAESFVQEITLKGDGAGGKAVDVMQILHFLEGN